MRPPALLAAAFLALAACRGAPPKPSGDASPPPLDEAALDRSASPCEDFYQYACGGWLAATEVPGDRPAWSRGFAELEERTALELRGILEAAAAGRVDPRDRFAGKVGDYYASCMDEAAVEARGLADLRAEWARIDAVGDRGTLVDELARIDGAGIAAPLAMYADQDAKDATQVVLRIVQGGLSLPDGEDYLSDAGTGADLRKLFAGHLRKMLALAGLPPPDVEINAAAVEAFERSLAETHATRAELRDPARAEERVDRAGLERLAPAFPWSRFFGAVGHGELQAVSISTPRFIERTGQLFEKTSLETWKAYLRWRVLAATAAARALPRAFVEERFRFESAASSGGGVLAPRWRHCVASTDQAIGFALGQTYVRLHLGAEGKDRTSRLVGEIERAMAADLDRRTWMDEPTRARAREKLAKVVNKIGYPEVWRDYSALRVGRESFFRNVLAAGRFELSRQLSRVGKPADRGEWAMSPPTVNAYYNPTLNELAFPAGILQPPFFNRSAPEAVNYGAIGMVVGHELTHGFDEQGRRYDAHGNLRDGWSPEVAKAFATRARCLVTQFAGYEPFPGVALDGKLTLAENVADLGGVKLAYAAMQSARRGRPDSEQKLLGFTAEQQFFLGFAQSWCSKEREEHARLHAATDRHAPARFRVNGPLSNLPEFAAAFSCKQGSAMVRPAADRCEVW